MPTPGNNLTSIYDTIKSSSVSPKQWLQIFIITHLADQMSGWILIRVANYNLWVIKINVSGCLI